MDAHQSTNQSYRAFKRKALAYNDPTTCDDAIQWANTLPCRLPALFRPTVVSKYKAKESVHRIYGSTVVDISIPPPFFKPVPLSFSRVSSILKQPKQVFFNPINIYLISFYHTLLLFL